MRLYLAGPMRGVPQFNFPAFMSARGALRAKGYEVFCPAEHDLDNGFDPAGLTGQEDLPGLGLLDLRTVLSRDLTALAESCDGVATLPGWEESKGACAEVALARALSLPVASVAAWADRADAVHPRLVVSPLASRPPHVVAATPRAATAAEERVTSATGGQKGRKPAQLSTLDPAALHVLAEVGGMGARKYAAHNYLKGYDWSLSFDACQRHLLAFWGGEDLDPESGLPHLGHAAWHCLAMISFLTRDLGTDDRPLVQQADAA